MSAILIGTCSSLLGNVLQINVFTLDFRHLLLDSVLRSEAAVFHSIWSNNLSWPSL